MGGGSEFLPGKEPALQGGEAAGDAEHLARRGAEYRATSTAEHNCTAAAASTAASTATFLDHSKSG